MQLHAALELTARGLPGERAHPAQSAVTVLSREARAAACRELGASLPWTCRVMDALHPGLSKALAPDWRGGVSCRVIAPAEIRVGAAVQLTR